MATYYIDQTQGSGSGSGSGGATSPNYLSQLTAMAGRNRYYDYLMGAEDRKQRQYDRARVDAREDFRLGLKKDVIAEKIQNDFYAAQYKAELLKRNRITRDPSTWEEQGMGMMDQLVKGMKELYPNVTIPQYLDSTSIRLIVDGYEASEDHQKLFGEQPELAQKRVNNLAASLNQLKILKSELATSNATLAKIPGALIADDQSPRGFRPVSKLYEYYVSEFGEDPLTGKAVQRESTPQKPTQKEVIDAAENVSGVSNALEDAGALDEVQSDSVIGGRFLKSISDWLGSNFDMSTDPSPADINADGSVTPVAYPGALSGTSSGELTGEDYITPLPSDNWRYDSSGVIAPDEQVTSVDLPVGEGAAPPYYGQESLMGRPLDQSRQGYTSDERGLTELLPFEEGDYAEESAGFPGFPAITSFVNRPPLTEINPDGGTMQTDYPDSLSDVSGSLSYPEMPAYNTDPTVTSEDLPLDGLEALEIQAEIDDAVQTDAKLEEIRRRHNQEMMGMLKDEQDMIDAQRRELAIREGITKYGFKYPAEIATAVLAPAYGLGRVATARATPWLYNVMKRFPKTRANFNWRNALRSAESRRRNLDNKRVADELVRRSRNRGSESLSGD